MVEGEETLESQKERTNRRFIEQKKRGQIPRKLYEESRFFTRYIYFITLCALALRRFSLLFCLPLTGKVAHSLVVRASASVNHPLFFQTARIMTSRWCGAAGKLDPKKTHIYYCMEVFFFEVWDSLNWRGHPSVHSKSDDLKYGKLPAQRSSICPFH